MKKKITFVFLLMALVLTACGPKEGKITAGEDPVSVPPQESFSQTKEKAPESKVNSIPEEVQSDERPLTQDEKDRIRQFMTDLENFPYSSAGCSLKACQLFAQAENDFIFYPQCKEGVDRFLLEEYQKLKHPENYDKTMNILLDFQHQYRENPKEIEALAEDAGVKIQPVLQEKMQNELFKALSLKEDQAR